MTLHIRKSLNVHAPWGQVLEALGIKTQSQVLPQTVQCPLCKVNKLSIYQDTTLGGSWHYCWGCKSAGDMIQLAGKAWKLGVRSTLHKLQKQGCPVPDEVLHPDFIQPYFTFYIEKRQKITQFWEDSRRALCRGTCDEVRSIMRKSGFNYTVVGERWDNGPSHLLGWSDKDTIEPLFAPRAAWQGGRESSIGRRPINPSAYRVFKGRRWNRVLVTPFYDLPGRICGFMFIGRDAGPDDIVFKRLGFRTSGTAEMGIGGLPVVWEAEHRYNNVVFAIKDPLTMLRMQLKQFTLNDRPLPLVCWIHEQTNQTLDAWGSLHDKKIVLWSPKGVDAPTLDAAIKCNAWISLAGPTNQSLRKYVDHTFHNNLMKRIADKAKRWPAAMAKMLTKLENHQVEDLFLQLRVTEDNMNKILELCDRETRERTQTILNDSVRRRTIVMKGKEVIEKEDGWYFYSAHKREELICDAILRIDQAIYQPRSNKTYYKGEIIYRGNTISFCDLLDDVEANTGKWMQQKILEAKQGLLKYKKGWSRDLLSIALEFSEPEFVEGDSMIGWDEKRQAIVLPGQRIELGGKVTNTDSKLMPGDPPGWSLDYGEFTKADAQWLTHSKFGLAPQFWATTASIICSLLSRLIGTGQPGIALTGDTRAFYSALSHLGCRKVQAVEKGLPDKHEFSEHDWPTPIRANPSGETALRRWINCDRLSPNVIVTMHEISGLVLAVNGGWNVIHVPQGAKECRFDHPAVYKVIPAAMRHIMAQEPGWGEVLYPEAMVLKMLHEFIHKHGGDPYKVRDANPVWWWPYDRDHNPEAFANLISATIMNGGINIEEKGFEPKSKTKLYLTRDAKADRLYVPLQVIESFLRKRKAPKLNFDNAQQGLDRAKAYHGSEHKNSKQTWIINLAWFEQLHSKYRSDHETSFKVVG